MNNKFDHTPGPWVVSEDTPGHIKSVAKDNSSMAPTPTVCRYMNIGDRIVVAHTLSNEEVEANARLIAAAPELLSGLINIWKEIKKIESSNLQLKNIPVIKSIKRIFILQSAIPIEKATGKEIHEVLRHGC